MSEQPAIYRPAWKSKRPAPRKAPGSAPPMGDAVDWTRVLDKPERYRIEYIDRDNEISVREIELRKIGTFSGATYYGVMHAGKFKTLRSDRIRMVTQLSTGHTASIGAQPAYSNDLPPWHTANPAGSLFRIPTIAGNRTWKVDLALYQCSCPEKRIRLALGYGPGKIGYVCPHMARAILDNLPNDHEAQGWTPALLTFLADPRKIHIDNLR